MRNLGAGKGRWEGLDEAQGRAQGAAQGGQQQPLTCTQLQRLQSMQGAAMSILPLFTSSPPPGPGLTPAQWQGTGAQ